MLVDKVFGYNNFYEFGLDKVDFVVNVGSLKIDLWILKISGEVVKLLIFDYDDLICCFLLEECIYCMCCVEVWLMVVLWIGFLLYKLLVFVEFISNVKYVVFEIIYVLEQMSGQQDCFIGGGLKYFYVEGLCFDEVMYLFILMIVGVYGKVLLL